LVKCSRIEQSMAYSSVPSNEWDSDDRRDQRTDFSIQRNTGTKVISGIAWLPRKNVQNVFHSLHYSMTVRQNGSDREMNGSFGEYSYWRSCPFIEYE
jgi:hypothetical protein